MTLPASTAATISPKDDLYNLVSGYYGPGAVALWLLAIYAVALTWLFHPRHSLARDTITNDFIFCLLYPVVAAGHLFIQLSHYPGTRRSIRDRNDKQLLPQAASILASVVICNLYGVIAFAFSFIFILAELSHNRNKRKFLRRRSVAVWTV
jgi:hypothetical protein